MWIICIEDTLQIICRLFASLHFPNRLGYSTLFMSTTVCSSACRRYKPLIFAVNLFYILLFLVITCTSLYTVVAIYLYQ